MMAGRVLLKPCCLDFGEKLVNFQVEQEDSQTFLTCRVYTFKPVTRKFDQSPTKVANSRICVHRGQGGRAIQCEIVDCQTLKLAETQQSFPFVLLKTWDTRKSASFSVFGLLVAGTSWTFASLGDSLTIDDEGARGWGPKLAFGPSLFWVSQGEFRVKRFQALAGVRARWRITLGNFHRVVAARLDFDWDSSQNLCGTLLLAVQAQTMSLVQKIHLSPVPGAELSMLDNFKCGPDLHGFLSKSTCCRFVHKTHLEENDGILLAMLSGQLLCFNDYKTPGISRSCKLPMNDAINFRFYKIMLPSEEYCIVDSAAGNSCVINLTSFQVAPSLQIADGFLFVHNGYLFQSRSDRHTPFVMASFEIKDLTRCLRPEGDADQTSSGLTSAMKALHSRVVAGKIAVSHALAESHALEKTTNEVAHAFQRLTTGEQNLEKGNKPYIYGLLTGKPVSVTRSMAQDSEPHHCSSLDIGTLWQRTVAGVRVIGVDVTNCTEKRVFELNLIVTVPFRSFQHSSKFFPIDEKYKIELQSAAPPAKKLRLDDVEAAAGTDVNSLEPSQSAILTVGLSSEVLGHRSKLNFNVAVAFKRKDGTKVTSSCVGCLPVTVAMRDVLSEDASNFCTESKGWDALHDLAALNTYTDCVEKLVVVSKETDLTTILNILQRRTNLNFHPYLDILFWKAGQLQSLWNAWLVLDKKSRFNAHVAIHARNRRQFFEVVHYLYEKLPADILLLPDDCKTLPDLSSSLLEEANLVSSYLGNVPGAEDRDQSECFASAPANLDMDGYRSFRNQLFELEQKTDNVAASVLTSKNIPGS